MNETEEDRGTYLVSLTRQPDNRIELTVAPYWHAGTDFYVQLLPAAYGDGMPRYDIAFQTSSESRAHPLDEMEYYYGPELGAEILMGVFKVAEQDFYRLGDPETGWTPPNTFATMAAAHDALVMCQERKKL